LNEFADVPKIRHLVLATGGHINDMHFKFIVFINFNATGWMIGGSSPGGDWEFFSSPPCPDRLWDPPSGRGVKLTIHPI
jgi:hypothetical protein